MNVLRGLAEMMRESGMYGGDMDFVLRSSTRSRRWGLSSLWSRGWCGVGQVVDHHIDHDYQNTQHHKNN